MSSDPKNPEIPTPPTEKLFDAPLDADPIRPHIFDGNICEYDKRMPNWWLFCFWGAILFAAVYWIWNQKLGFAAKPGQELKAEMAENTRKAARNSGEITDDILWEMSRDQAIVKSGAATFSTTCASCHMPDLSGNIGPNLKDTMWIHGGKPLEIMTTVTKGVLEKGMPTWGPILGKQKIGEVTAFILSYHKQGEPIQIVPSWTPPGAPLAPGLSQTGEAQPSLKN
jgi:cytochrome c oxidase cbb3-type subunit 3